MALILLALALSGGGHTEDRALIDRALGGDQRSVALLIDRIMPAMRAAVRQGLRRRGGSCNAHQGDDLVQEAWVRLVREDGRRLREYQPERGASLATYVALIASSEATDVLDRERARKRGGGAEADDWESHALPSDDDPESVLLGKELESGLARHLEEGLPARGRLVFRFLYGDGLSAPDTARAMNVSTQVVYNWQHRIRALVEEFVGQREA